METNKKIANMWTTKCLQNGCLVFVVQISIENDRFTDSSTFITNANLLLAFCF